MKIISNAQCRIGHHQPNRRKVKYNCIAYVSHCIHCGARLERQGHRDWREVGETPALQKFQDQVDGIAKKTDDAAREPGAKIKGLVTKRSNRDRQRGSLVRRSLRR